MNDVRLDVFCRCFLSKFAAHAKAQPCTNRTSLSQDNGPNAYTFSTLFNSYVYGSILRPLFLFAVDDDGNGRNGRFNGAQVNFAKNEIS